MERFGISQGFRMGDALLKQIGRFDAPPPVARIHSAARDLGWDEAVALKAVRTWYGLEPEGSTDLAETATRVGLHLGFGDDGWPDPAVRRALARGLARQAGEGDLERGAARLLRRSQGDPVLAAVRQGLLSALRYLGLGDAQERAGVLLRGLCREMACVRVEARLGFHAASLFTATQLERLCSLPDDVIERLAALVSDRQRPVEGSGAFGVLLARAWRLARPGDEKETENNAPPPREPVLEAISRRLERVDRLLRSLDLPFRAVLIPVESAPPAPLAEPACPPIAGTGVPVLYGRGEVSTPDTAAGTANAPATPPRPGPRPDPGPPLSVPLWVGSLLSPRLRSFLLVPV